MPPTQPKRRFKQDEYNDDLLLSSMLTKSCHISPKEMHHRYYREYLTLRARSPDIHVMHSRWSACVIRLQGRRHDHVWHHFFVHTRRDWVYFTYVVRKVKGDVEIHRSTQRFLPQQLDVSLSSFEDHQDDHNGVDKIKDTDVAIIENSVTTLSPIINDPDFKEVTCFLESEARDAAISGSSSCNGNTNRNLGGGASLVIMNESIPRVNHHSYTAHSGSLINCDRHIRDGVDNTLITNHAGLTLNENESSTIGDSRTDNVNN